MLGKILRIFVTVLAIIFLIWFIIPMNYRVINPGNILGILICIYLIFRFGTSGLYSKLKDRFKANKVTKALWNIHNIFVTAFAVYAVIISGIMVFYASLPPAKGSTAVVLGAQVKNGVASAPLMQRIRAGESYLNENPESAAVVTGGQGEDEAMSEGLCIYQYMTEDGIEKRRIYIEDKAENTYENIKFSYEIVEKNNLNKNLAIVTDSYHQLRARIIAEKQNINTSIGAVNAQNNRIGLYNYPTFFVREWIAIPVELLK